MFLIITILGLILYLRGHKYYGLVSFLFLLTDGFQFVPEQIMLFSLSLYGKDYALLFSITILLSSVLTEKTKFPYKTIVFISLVTFFFFLVVSAIVDLYFYNPSISGFMLIFRVNFFLLTYFWLSHLDKALFERLFKLVFIITIIQSILCIVQIPTGVRLLTGGGVGEFNEMGFHWVRYTNLPYFLLPCLFFTLMYKGTRIPYKGYLIALFLMTLLFTLTRTLILGLIITIVISVIIGLFNTQKRMILWFGVIFILSLPIIGARLMSSADDINLAINENTIEQGSNMTFAYRMFHFTERYLFISKDWKHKLLGIGFIHERDFPKETFLLGHKNDLYETTQLEQDDISWSNLFLRYGILGTILYLFIYLSFFISFYKARRLPVGAAAVMFMIMSLILTFASGRFSQADFFIVPFFFFFYIRQLKLIGS